MQAAGNLVGTIVEFAARMQHGHDDLCRRAPLFGVQVNRNATPIIADRHRLVSVYRYGNDAAKSCQRLIDRVVDDLKNHVVEAGAIIGVTNVHAWPFSDGLKAL